MRHRNLRFLLTILTGIGLFGCSSIVDNGAHQDVELLLTGNIDKGLGDNPGMAWAVSAPLEDDAGQHFDLIMINRASGDAKFDFTITFNEHDDSPQKGSYAIKDKGEIEGIESMVVRWPQAAESGRAINLTLRPTLSDGGQTVHLTVR